jgi:DNA polymerase-3 subunit alpha
VGRQVQHGEPDQADQAHHDQPPRGRQRRRASGRLQHAPEYVNRRHGAPFEYWDPAVEPALHETFGLPLYQEQIMAIFQLLGGYSASEADTVRRIMGKYYRIKGGVAAEMLAEHRDRFVASAARSAAAVAR